MTSKKEELSDPQIKYPSPKKKDKIFTEHWNILIGEIVSRENFKLGHLLQLKLLCEMYCEKYRLDDTIELLGTTYITEGGRNGTQEKIRPEVLQKNQVIRSILLCTKMLGLVLYKDTETGADEAGEEWN